MAGEHIAANVARLRLDRGLTQEKLAERAGISRIALGKIERGAVVPRSRSLSALGRALQVPLGDLVTRVRPLETVRFRARARVLGRAQILAEVAKWLDAYTQVEADLGESCPFRFRTVGSRSPVETAQAGREAIGLSQGEPVRDICGLLEENGVKLLLLDRKSEAFFGLSVGAADGGPAVVVNTWDRISVERWIFTAVHELGHLLLHPTEYQRDATEPSVTTEREADAFASHFLMPEGAFAPAWDETRGHPLLVRVPQGQAHLSSELQDRALPAGRVGPRDSGHLARIPAPASRPFRQDPAKNPGAPGARQERVRLELEPLRRARWSFQA